MIFGLTGNALEDDVNYFLKAGADCVVAKPLRRTQLDAILKCIDVYGRDSVPNVKLSMVVSGENAYILKEQWMRTFSRNNKRQTQVC